MPIYDCKCDTCEDLSLQLISIEGRDSYQEECKCGGTIKRIFTLKPPSVHCDANDYNAQIAKMKKASNERFIKKDLDDIRNKHGRSFDDSLVSAAAQRIKAENGL